MTFMGLPLEIRQMICRYLIQREYILYPRHIQAYIHSSREPLVDRLDEKGFPPAISLVSKTLRAEVFHLLLLVNTVDLGIACDVANEIQQFERRNKLSDSGGGCALLRHVFLWLPVSNAFMQQFEQEIMMLPACKKITTIRIKILAAADEQPGSDLNLEPIREVFNYIQPASVILHIQYCDLEEDQVRKRQDLVTWIHREVKTMIKAENLTPRVSWELFDMFDDLLEEGGDNK